MQGQGGNYRPEVVRSFGAVADSPAKMGDSSKQDDTRRTCLYDCVCLRHPFRIQFLFRAIFLLHDREGNRWLLMGKKHRANNFLGVLIKTQTLYEDTLTNFGTKW